MAIQVDGRRTVGPEAFAKITPACPAMAHTITVRNLFDALTNSTGGRLHFLIYHKYLKSLDNGHKAPALQLCEGEVILDIYGATKTKPILQHIGTSTWPGRLTLTNHALYFEAIAVDFSYNKAVVYDLSRDLKQNIKQVLHAHKFIRKYKLLNFQKAEVLSVATLGILRYWTVKEGFNILPAHFKTILAFNLAEKLPKGEKILEALYGQPQRHSSRFRGDEVFAQSSSDELTLAHPFPLSAYTLWTMGLLTLKEEDNPDERDLTDRDVQTGGTCSVQMALESRAICRLLWQSGGCARRLIRGWIGYTFPGFLLGSTIFMLWQKYNGNGQLIGAFEVTTPPRRRIVEQLLALQKAISQLEAHVQAGNIFLLKLRSLMLSAFPQVLDFFSLPLTIVEC
ncbi:hypothetical protein ABZP36_002795 [Zizania latifolia]